MFESLDSGNSWNYTDESLLPIMNAKMYAGVLSDGRHYLIYNEITEKRDRSRLVMSVGNKGEDFDKLYLIANGPDPVLGGGSEWHYPWTCEKEGYLYISCTTHRADNSRDAVLFKIPVSSL